MEQLTTLVSVAGTLVATAVSLFLLRQGQADRRQLHEEQRRQQAQRVTIWCDWNPNSPDANFDHPTIPAIFVGNASDEAVYEVFVDYQNPADGHSVRIEIGPVPPSKVRHRDVPTEAAGDPDWEPSALLPRLFFRDSEGRQWMRDSMGRLRDDPGAGNDGFLEASGRLALGLPRPSKGTSEQD